MPFDILRICYDFPPPWIGLGPGPYELTKAQVALGNRVTVYAGEWPRKRSYREGNMRVRRLPRCFRFVGSFATYGPAVLSTYLRERGKYDVIHAHNFHASWYYLYRKLWSDPAPLVLHMHITSAGRADACKDVDFFTRHLDWKLSILAEQLACRLAQAVVCVSESVKQEVLRWYNTDSAKVHVISNGVNTELFSPDGDNKRQRWGLGSSIVLLYVGVLNKRKRIDLIIRALMHLPDDFRLLVVGSGPEERHLKKLVTDLALHSKVKFTGYVPYPDLPGYYRTADLLVLTSVFEGMPKVVLEAVASGLKVLTLGSFNPGDVLRPCVNEIATVDPERIALEIAHNARGGEIGELGQIREEISWSVSAQRIQSLYESVLKPSKRT